MKKSNLLRAGAVLAALSFVGAACGSSSDSASDTTAPASAAATCDSPVAAIGWQGAETGDAGALGVPMIKGANLAIDEYNAANPDACVVLKKFDTQGDPAKAPAAAQAAIKDATILGIIGPGFSGESNAADPLYEEAGLATVTGSATNAELQNNGWKVFHRLLANDAKQGPAIANYLKTVAKKAGVIDDASDYGKGLADAVKTTLGKAVVATDTIDPKAADFSAAVTKMKSAGVDYIFYGGYYAEAAKLATQLKDAGVTAVLVGGDGVKDQAGFAEAAGPAAEGALISCPCQDGSADFIAKWQAKYNEFPGTYGAEYYDAANVILAAIKGGAKDRAAVLAAVKAYDADGASKHIKFGANGDVTEGGIYLYQVKSGKITFVQEIK
ncbi:MAG: branched-chain amino acid ABC transporter substrate-binding protein [Actinomycetes bacterium]|jgi:branched-chain amino acid transport system substrate-binding protein